MFNYKLKKITESLYDLYEILGQKLKNHIDHTDEITITNNNNFRKIAICLNALAKEMGCELTNEGVITKINATTLSTPKRITRKKSK